MTYIVQADLEARLTSEVVKQILDDNVDGTPDPANVTRLIGDAESKVESFLAPIYDLTVLRALGTNAPNEVKRLCLDVAVAYARQRHPEYVRGDWRADMEHAEAELLQYRKGERKLDTVLAPEPASTQGGIVESGDVDDPEMQPAFFLNPGSMGIF